METELEGSKQIAIDILGTNQVNLLNLKPGHILHLKSWRHLVYDVYGIDNFKKELEVPVVVTEDMEFFHGIDSFGYLRNSDGYTTRIRSKMIDWIEDPLRESVTDKIFSLEQDKPTELDIEEMISKVNFVLFKKLMAIGSRTHMLEKLSDDVLSKLMRMWAIAKWPMYVLFGRNLSVKYELDIETDSEEIDRSKVMLMSKFPQYALQIGEFSTSEWSRNVIDPSAHCLIWNYRTKNMMKLSTFLAESTNYDQEFSNAVAGVMENKTKKTNVYVSIDPYDYLTMSLNAYGWHSCHKLWYENGCYATGTVSYMLDSASMIAFEANETDHSFKYEGFSWKGNNKSWRQVINIDLGTSSMIFGRQYPKERAGISNQLRAKFEALVSGYLNVPDNWIIGDKIHPGYRKGSDLLYHDVYEDKPHYFVFHNDLKNILNVEFVIGQNAYCPFCGNLIGESSNTFSCGCE